MVMSFVFVCLLLPKFVDVVMIFNHDFVIRCDQSMGHSFVRELSYCSHILKLRGGQNECVDRELPAKKQSYLRTGTHTVKFVIYF
jgi:hypothetical protein